MKFLAHKALIGVALGCFGGAIPSAAWSGDAPAQNACFPPAALAWVPGEEIAIKTNRSYDSPPKLDGLNPVPAVPELLRGSIRRVNLPGGQKVVALTFDLCEQRGEIAGYDGRIIDNLRKEGIKATFFAGGKWMASHQARTEQLMLDPLFEVGNHTETHPNLRLVSTEVARQEILAPQRIFELTRAHLAARQCSVRPESPMSRVPEQPKLFRFPYGACNDATLKAVSDAGMLAIQWDVATGDPSPQASAAAIANAMINQAKPGSIIINHANGRGWHTAEALQIAIPSLKAKGYSFVTVSELIAMGKPVIAAECYDRHPGDTNRYDFLSGLQHPLNSATKSPPKMALAPGAGAKYPRTRTPKARKDGSVPVPAGNGS